MSQSMAEFFAMGGYARFVWGAYGITLIVLVFNVVSARRRLRSTIADLALRNPREPNRSSQ